MTPLFRKFLGMHWILFVIMGVLLAIGVYSVYAAVHFRDGDLADLAPLWRKQITLILAGLAVFFGAALVDYKWVKWGAVGLYVLGIVLLLALHKFGVEVYKQKIALPAPVIGQFQPGQIAIAATILLLAVVLGEGHKLIPWMRHYLVRFLVSSLLFAFPFLLMLKFGDLGSAMVIVPVAVAMLVVGNIPFRCLIAVALLGLSILPWVYYFGLKDYQKARITVTMDLLAGREVDIKGDGWALNNILIAVGSSGYSGKGLDPEHMDAHQKNMLHLGLLPPKTSHNDFIFAVICETFGFRGAALLIGGFVFLLCMCLTVAFFARDSLGRLIATGVIALLFAHTFEHMGMNIGLLPITGIPLPFISYGGTFMVMVLFLMGLLQSVWVHRSSMLEEATAPKPGPRPRPAPAYA